MEKKSLRSFLLVSKCVLRSERGVIPIIGPILAWLLAMEAKFITVEVGKYLAYRALLIVMIWTLGPIAIFESLRLIFSYLVPFIIQRLSATIQSGLGEDPQPQIVQLYGVGSYLAGLMKISEGITIYMVWVTMKFTWKMLPKPLGIGR